MTWSGSVTCLCKIKMDLVYPGNVLYQNKNGLYDVVHPGNVLYQKKKLVLYDVVWQCNLLVQNKNGIV
jgi:hypothetical protein